MPIQLIKNISQSPNKPLVSHYGLRLQPQAPAFLVLLLPSPRNRQLVHQPAANRAVHPQARRRWWLQRRPRIWRYRLSPNNQFEEMERDMEEDCEGKAQDLRLQRSSAGTVWCLHLCSEFRRGVSLDRAGELVPFILCPVRCSTEHVEEIELNG